jgi:hypothetical protein
MLNPAKFEEDHDIGHDLGKESRRVSGSTSCNSVQNVACTRL